MMNHPLLRQKALHNKTVKICCVVPVHNEKEVIESFLLTLREFLKVRSDYFQIIAVDDGSRDGSSLILERLAQDGMISLITLSRNFGKEVALTAGIECSQADVTILIDGDFQHPIEMIDTFLEHWVSGIDMVYGVRENRRSESWLKRIFTTLFYRIMSSFTEINIPQNAGDFRLLDSKVLKALKTFEERNRFMKGLYAWVGFSSKGVLFEARERAGGSSSWHFSKLTELAITGIISFSDAPLRIWSFIGVMISACSFVFAIYIVLKTLVTGVDVPGFATVITAITFLGGIQLLSIGILGEYVARIFSEVKKRPKYVVDKTYGLENNSNNVNHSYPE